MPDNNTLSRSFEAKIDDVSKPRRTVTAKVNTSIVDRYRTVIAPSGGNLKNYMASGPAVLWEHGKDPTRGRVPVAHCDSLKYRRMDDDLLAVMRFKDDEYSRRIFDHYADGTLVSFSIEFLPDESASSRPTREEVRDRPDWKDAEVVYRKWEMTGLSAVSYPGNPQAVALAVERGLWVPEETLDLIRTKEEKKVEDSEEDEPSEDEIDQEELDDLEFEEEEPGEDDEELEDEEPGEDDEELEDEEKSEATRSGANYSRDRFNPNHSPSDGKFSGGGGGKGKGKGSKGGSGSSSGGGAKEAPEGPAIVKVTYAPKMTVHKRKDGGVQVHSSGGSADVMTVPSKSGKYHVVLKKTQSGKTGKGVHTDKKGNKWAEESIHRSQDKANKAAKDIGKSHREANTFTEKHKVKDGSKFDLNEHLLDQQGSSKAVGQIKKEYSISHEIAPSKAKSDKKGRDFDLDEERAMSEGGGSQGGYLTKQKDDKGEKPGDSADDEEPDSDEDDDEDIKRYITHDGDQWIVHAEDGKVLGKHPSKAEAVKQLQAIEAHKHAKDAPKEGERALDEARVQDMIRFEIIRALEERNNAPIEEEAPPAILIPEPEPIQPTIETLPMVRTFTLQELSESIVEKILPITRAILALQAQDHQAQMRDLNDLIRGRV